MSVIIPQQSGRATTVERPAAGALSSGQFTAWKLLGWLGLGFLIMSVIDISLGWYPLRFGTAEWEYGSISATVVGLSIPCLSLYLILSSSISLERRNQARAAAIVMIVFALILPALGILFLTNVPLALKATLANEAVHLGMKKSVIKTLLLFTGYELLFIYGAFTGLRRRSAV